MNVVAANVPVAPGEYVLTAMGTNRRGDSASQSVTVTGQPPSAGECAISRTIDGRDRVFLIYFLKDSDGVWRIDAM